jgi:carbonic anhydrase/acetyltransferase-like protein (isoleucine patch superfamily)
MYEAHAFKAHRRSRLRGDLMPLYEIDGRRPSLPTDGSVWLAPSAEVIGDADLGAGSSIWFHAVVRADNTQIIIGKRTNVQDGAMLHSDAGSPLTIGADVTVGHHAILHGCTIGDRVLVGMGAIVLNNAVIGDDCLIGAGAVVTERKVFPPGSLVVGSPAIVRRLLSIEEIAALRQSAAAYQDKQMYFKRRLRRIDPG